MSSAHDGNIDEQIIKEKSTIFGKSPNDYQKAINTASFQLCLSNPSLLLEKKGDLLDMARKKVHEDSYCYKKGRTRSKKLEPSLCEEGEPQPKRQKITACERQRRIKELTEEISGLNCHVEIKEQRIDQANNSRNYRMCDELAGEVSDLKSKRHQLNAELADLQHRTKKATQCQKRKSRQEDVDEQGDSSDQETLNTGEENFSLGLPTAM